MRLIKVYLLKHWKMVILPLIAMVMTRAIDTAFPYLQKLFVDDIILGNSKHLLKSFLIIFLLLIALRAIGGYIKEYLFDAFATRIVSELRLDIFAKIESMDFNFFDKQNTGELISRIGEDIDSVWETVSYGFRLCIEIILLFILSSWMMFILNSKLAVVCLLFLVPVSVMGWIFEQKCSAIYLKISDQKAEINHVAQENLSGIRLVKAFAREKYEIIKFLNTNQELYELNLTQAKLVSLFTPVLECLTQFSHIMLIVLGGILCIKGELSIGVLLAFSGYILDLSWAVKNMGNFLTLVSQNKACMKRIFDLLDQKPQITSPKHAYYPQRVKGDICFKDVCFTYNDKEVLSHINLFIPAGSSVAIMGSTGCGKSTLLSLIGRYYDVTSGEILVDGINVKDWDLRCLRKHTAFVFQDLFLFSDSIRNNIDFGESKTLDRVKKAADISSALNFIDELEEGFDTQIGERGIGLSGGQKQRLTISRALIQDAPILILDDATSALDMETEYTVLQNLSLTHSKATKFIVAHRISSVKEANLILYMKDGQIAEKGTHETLIAKKGYYYAIYRDQFKDLLTLKEATNNA